MIPDFALVETWESFHLKVARTILAHMKPLPGFMYLITGGGKSGTFC